MFFQDYSFIQNGYKAVFPRPPPSVNGHLHTSRSPEVVAALSGQPLPSPLPLPDVNGCANEVMSSGTAPSAPAGGRGVGGGPGGALLALRRAAFTGALEKPSKVGVSMSVGEAEAEKDTFWRGHAKVCLVKSWFCDFERER